MSNSVGGEHEKFYKCFECGAEGQYTLHSERIRHDIWDGPHGPPIGYIDEGAAVEATCNVCKADMDVNIKDIERLFSYRQGVVFYKNRFY